MKPRKHPLIRERIRRPPRDGWSWLDRRFVRDHASTLTRDAILLYFFLSAVSDKDGLSYWSDGSTAGRLRIGEESLREARDELLSKDLIAHQREPSLYQVLSLSDPPPRDPAPDPASFRDILSRLSAERCDGNSGKPPTPDQSHGGGSA